MTGKRVGIAVRDLERAGATYQIVPRRLMTMIRRDRWEVCWQNPQGGTHAAAVTLVIAQTCRVESRTTPVAPNILYERLGAAEDQLRDVGVEVEIVNESSDHGAPGAEWIVCEQEPRQGVAWRRMRLHVAPGCIN